ncbi:DUF6046 domain-containing protein [Proteiniphilum sp.]|uniref:DUF6046 domain-containing protein n=1 Tax=Proteiniphilum sp. TaxID=1926877 RepID=UPI002B22046F|nr:DUF6046 domain-containing protein [Proteiniphilum sp.]MEA4916544.1 DUF6046 domain-containing protein [Proteiniphilum sp.]MEA4948779.1 DUF6046 domain-containing protein [Petrimonas sp.]
MKIDFAGRFQSAFGFITKSISSRLDKEGFGDVIRNSHNSGFDLGGNVYVWDDNMTFDEVTLRSDVGGKYLFAFRPFSEETGGDVFATPPMLSLRRSKRLIITTIDNSDTEVVERYSTEPYEITWRGLLIDMENHSFPIDRLEQINKIFEVNGVWNVDSEILQAVGVAAVYFRDIQIDFVEGFEDTISYTFTTRAINPVTFQLSSSK